MTRVFVPARCHETLHDLNIGFACLGQARVLATKLVRLIIRGRTMSFARLHHKVDDHLRLLIGDRLKGHLPVMLSRESKFRSQTKDHIVCVNFEWVDEVDDSCLWEQEVTPGLQQA